MFTQFTVLPGVRAEMMIGSYGSSEPAMVMPSGPPFLANSTVYTTPSGTKSVQIQRKKDWCKEKNNHSVYK